MPSASDQWYRLNVSQLIRKTGQGDLGAQDALEKYNKFKQAGGEPVAFVSGRSFWVLDDNDNDKDNRSSIRRLNNESKPYPG